MMAQFGRWRRRDPTVWLGRFELVHFAGSTAIYQAARLGFSLVAARFLAPDAFAIWALIVTGLVYAPNLLLGVANGMARELPIVSSSRESGRAEGIVATTWFTAWVVLFAITVAGGVLLLSMPENALIVAAVVMLVGGTVLHTTQQMMLRSVLRFGTASLQLATFGLGLLTAGVVLAVQRSGEVTLVAAAYAVPLWVSVSVGLIKTPRAPISSASFEEIFRLVWIGFPIMLAGLSFSLFVTMDRWLAVQALGPLFAGPYTLASLLAAALLVLPSVISQQTYPRMAVARGKGSNAEHLKSMARSQGRIAALLTLPVALGVAAFVPVVIPWLLPAYSDAIPAVIALMPGLLLMTLFAGYGNYLNVAGAQWRYLGTQIAAIAVGILLMTVGAAAFGLAGIALGMSFSLGGYGVLLYVVARRTPLAHTLGIKGQEVGEGPN